MSARRSRRPRTDGTGWLNETTRALTIYNETTMAWEGIGSDADLSTLTLSLDGTDVVLKDGTTELSRVSGTDLLEAAGIIYF